MQIIFAKWLHILITQHGSGKYHHVDQIFPHINILNTWKSWVQDEDNESLPFDIKGYFRYMLRISAWHSGCQHMASASSSLDRECSILSFRF